MIRNTGFQSGHRALLLFPTIDPTAAATPQPRAGIRRGSTLLPFPLFRFCLAQFALRFFLAQFVAAGVARYACHQFIFFSPVYINENDTMCEKLSPVLVFLYILIYDTIYVSHHVVLISLVLSFYILNLCKKDVITFALRKLCI